MDPEEINAIADKITQQWISLVNRTKSGDVENKSFYKELDSNLSTVLRYEDEALLEYALDVIPIQQLYDEVEGDDVQDELVKRLLHWFKNAFFSWVDVTPCDHCGSVKNVIAVFIL
jgi:hypothetical protein